jgi:hypothetical protein
VGFSEPTIRQGDQIVEGFLAEVPEPSTLAFGLGLLAIGARKVSAYPARAPTLTAPPRREPEEPPPPPPDASIVNVSAWVSGAAPSESVQLVKLDAPVPLGVPVRVSADHESPAGIVPDTVLHA